MMSENFQGLALEGRDLPCILKAAKKMDIAPSRRQLGKNDKKSIIMLSVNLKTGLPGTRDGDSQTEKSLCNSNFCAALTSRHMRPEENLS